MFHILKCLADAAVRIIKHDGIEHAGYMSFIILLSIFPFVIFLLAVTSFFGASDLGQNLVGFLLTHMPSSTTEIIRTRLSELSNSPPQSLLNLAIIGSIWTASSFVECLRTILNRVYEITSPPSYIVRRLLSILQFFILSTLITFAIFLFVVIPIGLGKIPIVVEPLKKYALMLDLCRYFFILLTLFISASTLYYLIPNVRVSFVEIIPGSILTVLLWIISGHLLSENIIYYNQLNIVYGSLGSIIVTLIFFYIINVIFIYGAEFNYLLKQKNTL